MGSELCRQQQLVCLESICQCSARSSQHFPQQTEVSESVLKPPVTWLCRALTLLIAQKHRPEFHSGQTPICHLRRERPQGRDPRKETGQLWNRAVESFVKHPRLLYLLLTDLFPILSIISWQMSFLITYMSQGGAPQTRSRNSTLQFRWSTPLAKFRIEHSPEPLCRDRQTSKGGLFANKKTNLIVINNSVVSSTQKCIKMRAAVDLEL